MGHIVFLKNKKHIKGNIIEEKPEGIIIEITDYNQISEILELQLKKWFIPFSNILYIGFIE